MNENNISIFLMFIGLFMFIQILQEPQIIVVQQSQQVVEPAQPAEKMQSVIMTYFLNIDTVYTGSEPTYTTYAGQESVEVLEHDRSLSGMPWMKSELRKNALGRTVINFQRVGGESCELHVPVASKLARVDGRDREVPAAVEAEVFCASSDSFRYVDVHVDKRGDSITIFAAPTKKEVDVMTKQAGIQI